MLKLARLVFWHAVDLLKVLFFKNVRDGELTGSRIQDTRGADNQVLMLAGGFSSYCLRFHSLNTHLVQIKGNGKRKRGK